MLKQLLGFILWLILVSGLTYIIHVLVLKQFLADVSVELIKQGYMFNIGFTLTITSSLILARRLLKNQWGFVFLATGFIKLSVFLFLIKISDFQIDKSVFLHFFIPYLVCVVVEIIYVIHVFNRPNLS